MDEQIKTYNRTKKRMLHLILLLLLLALDQGTKLWARTVLAVDDIAIIPKVLRFTFVKNTGAVFGLFRDQVIPLAILSLIILAAILWFYFRIPDDKKYMPMAMIAVFVTAGAIGNLMDRIFIGYVTDFIYFELINFAVFNVADMYITVSAILLILLTIFYYKDDEFEFIFKTKAEK